MDVEAASLEELFHRAAMGTMAFLHEHDDLSLDAGAWPLEPGVEPPPAPGAEPPAPGGSQREMSLDADDVASLLVRWLRELLYLHDVHGLAYRSADFRTLDARRLEAVVALAADEGPETRELKGVTYHDLQVHAVDSGWRARIIFDV